MSDLTRADMRNLAVSAIEEYLNINDEALETFTRQRLEDQGIQEDDIGTVLDMLVYLEVKVPGKDNEMRYA